MMKIFLLSLALTILAQAEPKKDIEFGDISITTAKQLIKSPSAPIIIDVRTAEEFKEGHISGAQNIDVRLASFKTNVEKLDKSKTYLIHCRSGGRSSKALKVFTELGFSKIYHMKDGYMNWE